VLHTGFVSFSTRCITRAVGATFIHAFRAGATDALAPTIRLLLLYTCGLGLSFGFGRKRPSSRKKERPILLLAQVTFGRVG
jgi:hypothetical protein